MAEVRAELTSVTKFGTMLKRPIQTLELRGGREVPLPEESRAELRDMKRVARDVASRAVLMTHTLVPIEGLRMFSPSQLERITVGTEAACWELPVYQDPERARYGSMQLKGIPNPSNLAHRTMYLVFFGTDALPNRRSDFLDHLCENKACCYPRHLERVTSRENTLRGRAGLRLDQVMLTLPDEA